MSLQVILSQGFSKHSFPFHPWSDKVLSCQWTMQIADQNKLKHPSGTGQNQVTEAAVRAEIAF